MQSLDLFSLLPADPQPQGAGLAQGGGLAGLFAPAEGEGADVLFGQDQGFAEALLAVLGAAQNQAQPLQPAPAGSDAEGATESTFAEAPRSVPPSGLLAPALPEAQDGDAAVAADEPGRPFPAPAAPSAELAAPALAPSPRMSAMHAAAASTGFDPVANQAAPDDTSQASGAMMEGEAFDLAAAPGKSSTPQAQPAPVPQAAPQKPAAPATLPPAADASPVEPAPQLTTIQSDQSAETSPAEPTPPAATARPAQAAPQPASSAQAQRPARAKELATAPGPVGSSAQSSPTAVQAQAAANEVLTEQAVAGVDAAPAADETPLADAFEPAPHAPSHAEARGHVTAATIEAPKATPQTVATLSAQIAAAADAGKSTRFEVQLEPLGLGKVEVKVEITRSGDVRADLSFESPLAAAELRARSSELQGALERAGFDPSKTQLSFNSGGHHQGGQFAQEWRDQQQQQQGQSWRGAAFMDLTEAPQNPVAAYHARARDGGVDVRI